MINKPSFNPEVFVGMSVGSTISLESILLLACRRVGTTREQTVSKTRENKTPYARQLYCYVAANFNQKSLKEIGRLINCDHSTVIASRNKIQNEVDFYDDVKSDVNYVKSNTSFENKYFITSSNDRNHVGYYDTPEKIKLLKSQIKKTKKGEKFSTRNRRVLDTESGTVYSSIKDLAYFLNYEYITLYKMLIGENPNTTKFVIID